MRRGSLILRLMGYASSGVKPISVFIMVNTMALDRKVLADLDGTHYYDVCNDMWKHRKSKEMIDWKIDRVLENEARKLFKRERDGNK